MRGRIYTLDPPNWTMPVARSFKVFRTPRRKMLLLIRGIRLHLARTELTAWVLRAQVNLIFNNWSCIYGTNDNYICLSLFDRSWMGCWCMQAGNKLCFPKIPHVHAGVEIQNPWEKITSDILICKFACSMNIRWWMIQMRDGWSSKISKANPNW
jgi:hypothetical protein